MQRQARAFVPVALLAASLTACSERSSAVNERPTIRLSPMSVTATGLDAKRLVDRDTTEAVPVATATSVALHFGHPVEIRKVKVHGATAVRVVLAGLSLGAADEAGWASGTLPTPVTTSDLELTLEPTGAPARLDEVEVWGAGRDVGSREPDALARQSRAADAPAFENVWVLRASPDTAKLVPPGAGDGSPCLRARLPEADPRQARRAYLVYEANVPRAVALQHAFGGGAPSSGMWLGNTSDVRTLVTEIDPERLRGADDVLLCLPDEAGGSADVTGLRVLFLLDDGSSPFDRDAVLRYGEALDGRKDTVGGVRGTAEVGLDRVVDVESAQLDLGHVPTRIERLARNDGAVWHEEPGFDASQPSIALPLLGRATALRVDFPAPSRADVPSASIAELSVLGSGVGSRAGAPRIVITYPPISLRDGNEVGERFGPKAFVAGWAESAAGRGTVEIDGARVDTDGAFSLPLSRDLAATGSWPITVRARFPDGSEVTRTLQLDDDRERELLGEAAESTSTSRRFGNENQTGSGVFDPVAGGKVSLGTDVSVEGPAGAVSGRTTIGITRKGPEVMPHLDAGMINVTAPAHSAYRFTPKGQKFAQPVRVTIPYDAELLPEGVAPEEVQTYYFDEEKDRWLTLPRREVRRDTRQIVSETTHFTFMINAVMVLPDHPGPVSFNPNSIKDLKAADPSAGIDLIEAPQGNGQGTARVSFPIRLPRARGAYQPSLALSYDSGNGNGWLGVGWDLPVSRVQIDGRYGVAEYNGEERYLLDGEPIVPVDRSQSSSMTISTQVLSSAPTSCLDGSVARLYRARVERDFRRILRCGGDPAHYWFQVEDKAGTLFVYGRGENARLTSYIPRITTTPGAAPAYDIAEWALERVVDANGNLTQFGYQLDSRAPGDEFHKESYRQIYLRSITYTGTVADRRTSSALALGQPGPYVVEFHHEQGWRPDEIVSARAGFKTVMRRRLGSIEVRLTSGTPSGLVRRYDLHYVPGDLGKSLLKKIVVLGADEKVFYSHSFEYVSKAPDRDGVTLFGSPIPWVPETDADWGIGGTQEKAFGFHGFVGLGLSAIKSKGTVGVGFGYGKRYGDTLVSMVDLNGDGLPDRIYDGKPNHGSDRFLFNQGAGHALSAVAPAGDPAAGSAIAANLFGKRLGKDTGSSFDASLQAFYGRGSLNFGASYSMSKSSDFVIDANGDGLPDIVNGGTVSFNQPRSASCAPGTPESQCCPASGFCFLPSMPVPALQDLGDSASLVSDDATLADANQAMAEVLTPEDAVIEWTAPIEGNVDVTADLAFVNPPGQGGRRDGVRLRVYRYDPFASKPAPELQGTYLKPPDDATATPVRLANVSVHPGTIVYFVLSTLADFPMNDAAGNVAPLERVRFAPVITYRGANAKDRSLKDVTGADLYRFDADKDFVLAGNPQGAVTVPRSGRVKLEMTLSKLETSDGVRLCVQYQPPPEGDEQPTPFTRCSSTDAVYVKLDPSKKSTDETLAAQELTVAAGGKLYFRIDTDVAIDPRAVKWSVHGSYSCVQGQQASSACVLPDPLESSSLSFQAVPFFPLHEALDATIGGAWKPLGSVLKPFAARVPGKLQITSAAQYANRSTPIFFTVRTLEKSLLKMVGNHGTRDPNGAILNPKSLEVDLDAGEQVFLEAHTESLESLQPITILGVSSAPIWTLTCKFVPKDPKVPAEDCSKYKLFTTDRTVEGFDGGNQPALSGGFHGWRYGAWNGKDGEEFQPWVYRGMTKAESQAGWNKDDGEATVGRRQKDKMKGEKDTQRVRLRLLGLVVPSVTGTRLQPDQDALESEGNVFVTQDGNTYFAGGVVHAGRKGQSASNQIKDPGASTPTDLSFQIGQIGRSSTAVTVSAGVGFGLPLVSVGGSLSAGLSGQKIDVLDMNGDGILDVVASPGLPSIADPAFWSPDKLVNGRSLGDVRVTSPVTLATARKVQMDGYPQLSYDVSGQVNLGVSPPMRDLDPVGNTKAMVSRFPGFGGGLAFSAGNVVEQLVDINGDGLPDAVRRSTTGCPSGLGVHLNMGTSFAAAEDCVKADAAGLPSSGLLAAIETTGDTTDTDTSGGTALVSDMGKLPGLRQSTTVTLQGTSGADLSAVTKLEGGHDMSEAFGVSVAVETSLTTTNVALVDVTGDGLPDYVYKANAGNDFYVRVNRGFDFAIARKWQPENPWPTAGYCPRELQAYCPARKPRVHLGKILTDVLDVVAPSATEGVDPIEATGSHSVRPSTSFSFDFAFPIVIVEPWMHIGVGFSATPKKVGGFELGLQDIDGDGLPDHVLKTSDNKPVWARLNQLGQSNLLKSVVRPLGGKIDISYEQRVGNTVEMPQSRWVMTSVTVRDGRAAKPGETGHDLTTTFAYAHGRYDRIEREFLGFEKVTRTNPDGTSVEQIFDNETVVTKGLLRSERLLGPERPGSDRQVWVETVNTWSKPVQLSVPAEGCLRTKPILLDPDTYCGSFFTKLEAVQKSFYEGGAQPGIVTRQELEYDWKGDVVAFRDLGDLADPSDDLSASILYDDTKAMDLYSISRPRTVEVRDRSGKLLRARTADYDANGNLKTFTADLGNGRSAITELFWNTSGPARGLLEWVKGADNGQGQRYQTWYGYDEVASTYVTSIRDSHGYASSAKYDPRFGEVIRTTDVNGRVTLRSLDAFGRLERLAAPRDTLDAPTVWITYAPDAKIPYAWTHNRLPRKEGDRRGAVDTVVVMDGLGRVIQTKKTAEIATSETTKGVGWSVTGHQVFDVMGRVHLQGQTFASFSSRPEYVEGTPRNPTRLLYDDLGRMIETVEPDGSLTRVAYGFGTPAGAAVRRFQTTTWDAEGRAKAAYKDASDRVVAVEERIEGRTPTTQYEYSPVGDLLRVVDAAGNVTRLEYDLLGRRTRLANPDAGDVRFELAPAGNVVRKYDPNLDATRGTQRWIQYVYDFDQLAGVSYPDSSRDVAYTYGKPGVDEGKNGVGRVIEVKDDAGRELRTYGELGELASTTRILRPLRPGDRERTFKTSFTYDAFGRMLTITYPDDERVEYEYDAGGLLEKATGHRGAGAAVPGDEVYLASMMYDEFGQRVRMVLGNGVVSSYTYEPLTRRLHTLTTNTPLQRKLQAITYGYDRVGNVKTMVNALGEPVGDRSGEVRFEYGYDELYRLTWANGEAKSRPHTIDRFTTRYAYSDVHNMTSNVQVHEILHGGAEVSNDRPPKTNHEFAYAYDPAHPHQATKIGDTFLVYDGNGNTVRECRDQGDPTCQTSSDKLRRYVWTEENRLDQVIDGGGRNITRFVYDAAGDRVVKLGRGGESITIGQFWSLKGRRAATKHIFAGATRLASKLLPPPGWDDRTAASGNVSATTATATSVTNTSGCDPSDYQPQKCPVLPGGEPQINHQYDDTRVRPETYYYHPDHLGSTSWVTDQHARVHEHVEYFPYGEVWRDPRSDADGGPVKGQRFLFTGKELDEETGLVYFGARYYDPVHGRWISTDPVVQMLHRLETDPSRAFELGLYSYAGNRPIIGKDPDGRAVFLLAACFFGGCESLGAAVVSAAAWTAAIGATAWAAYRVAHARPPPQIQASDNAKPSDRAPGPKRTGPLVDVIPPTATDTSTHQRRRDPNVMRLQLQTGHEDLPVGSTLANTEAVGVTKAQAWGALADMAEKTTERNPGLGKSKEFSAAVVRISEKIKAVQGGVGKAGDTSLREEFTYRGVEYRIDLENIKGHNLRQ